MDPTRRQVLSGLGAAWTASAGCLGIGGEADPDRQPNPSPSGAWPAFGRDNANTAATSVSLSAAPSVEWTYDGPEGAVTAQPVVGSGHVVVGGRGGYVHCVNATTGEKRWMIPTTGTVGNPAHTQVTGYPVLSAAVLGPEAAYVPTTDGFITRMHVREGTKVSVTKRAGGDTLAYTAPVLEAGTLYAGSDAAGLHAYRTSSHERTATYDTGGPVSIPPALDAETLVAVTADAVYGFDVGGEQRWRVEASPTGAPTIADGRVYVPERREGEAGRLLALDLQSGSSAWRAAIPSESASPAVSDGRVYVAGSGGVAALEADGATRWRASSSTDATAPAVAGETLVVPCANGELRGRDTADGSRRWTVDVGGTLTPPAVGTERVLVGSADGSVAAIA